MCMRGKNKSTSIHTNIATYSTFEKFALTTEKTLEKSHTF